MPGEPGNEDPEYGLPGSLRLKIWQPRLESLPVESSSGEWSSGKIFILLTQIISK
jgi:hypothetical protein